MRLRRWIAAVAALAVALPALLAAGTAPAYAEDDYLVHSSPNRQAELDLMPGWVTLVFKTRASAKLAKIVVLDAAGANVTTGALIVEGTNVTTQLAFELPRGTYSVYYRTSDADGEPRGGAYQFAYGPGQWTPLDAEVWRGEAEQPPIIANPDPNPSAPVSPGGSAAPPSPGTSPTSPGAQPSGTSSSAPGVPARPGTTSPTAWLIAAGAVVAGLLAWAIVLYLRRRR